MGTSAEQIALQVSSTADTRALGQVRQELKETAAETNAVTVSAKQMSEALKQTGGDLQKAAQLLAAGNATAKQAVAQATGAVPSSIGAGGGTAPGGSPLPAGAGISGVPESVRRANGEVDKLNPKLRTAANSLGIISQAAISGQGSMAGLAAAVGNVAAGMSTLVTTAKALQTTTLIGILATLGSVVFGIYEKITGQAKTFNEQIAATKLEAQSLGKALGGDELGSKLDAINKKTDLEVNKLRDVNFAVKMLGINEKERLALIAAIEERRDKELEGARKQFAEEQRQRTLQLFDRQQELAGESQLAVLDVSRIGTFKLQLQQLQLQAASRRTEIDHLREIYDQYGNLKPLTKEQADLIKQIREQTEFILKLNIERVKNERDAAQQQQDIEARSGSRDLKTRYEAAIDLIRQQRAEAIKSTEDETTANQIAQNKIRLLRHQTAVAANNDAKTIFDVLRDAHDKTLKSIGTFGENVRRIIIGAEAARAAVRAAHEAGEAIASAAVGDFRGAALHGAAALQLGAAAALGAQESLGGGGSNRGGGGGGNVGTFSPSGGGGGDVHLTIQTIDPTSGSVIQETIWHINRSELLKRPVVPPPQRRSA